MATTGTENTVAKEKRVTSPSTLRKPADPANRKRSPKSSLTKPESSGKQIPNYLKPTLSSRVDQASAGPTAKRAPSSSKVQKPVLFSSLKEKTSPVHPLPGPKKPTISKKPISGKPVTKTVYRVVKPQPSPVSKNNTSKDNATPTNDVNVIHDDDKLPEQDFDEKEESLMGDAEEELVKVESGVELFPLKSKDFVDNSSDADMKTQENDEKLNKSCDISTVSEDEKNIIQTNEQNEEIVNGNRHIEEENTLVKDDIENTVPEVTGEPKSEETEIANEGEEGNSKSEDGVAKGEEKVVEEAKKEAENVHVVKHQAQAANKKGNAPSYNSVIEETTSKLMEKKNKVRAMAGAFETVIALQD